MRGTHAVNGAGKHVRLRAGGQAMAQNGIGPVGEAPAALPRGRGAVFGKIGLGVSFVPWAVLGALVLLRPG